MSLDFQYISIGIIWAGKSYIFFTKLKLWNFLAVFQILSFLREYLFEYTEKLRYCANFFRDNKNLMQNWPTENVSSNLNSETKTMPTLSLFISFRSSNLFFIRLFKLFAKFLSRLHLLSYVSFKRATDH